MKKYLILLAMFIGLVSCGITSNDESDKTFMEYKRAPKVRVLAPNLQLSNDFISEIIRLENMVDIPYDYDITSRGDTLIFVRKTSDWYIEYYLDHSSDAYCSSDTFYFNKNTGDFIKSVRKNYTIHSNGEIENSSKGLPFQILIDTVLDIVSFDSAIFPSSDTVPDTLVFNLTDGTKAKIGMKKTPNLELYEHIDFAGGKNIIRTKDSSRISAINSYGYGKTINSTGFFKIFYFNNQKVLDSVRSYEVCNGYRDSSFQHKINYIALYKNIIRVDISYYDKFTEVERRILYKFVLNLVPIKRYNSVLIKNNLDTTGYWYYQEYLEKFIFKPWHELDI